MSMETPREKIRTELRTCQFENWDDDTHLAVLKGYRDYYASEWYRKSLANLYLSTPAVNEALYRQMALVLTWAIEKIAPGTPLDN